MHKKLQESKKFLKCQKVRKFPKNPYKITCYSKNQKISQIYYFLFKKIIFPPKIRNMRIDQSSPIQSNPEEKILKNQKKKESPNKGVKGIP